MWLSLALLTRLAAHFGDHQPVTIDRAPEGAEFPIEPGQLRARLLHQGRVVALVQDEKLAGAFIALLNSAPRSLQAFAETFVEVLRQHSETDDGSMTCRECGRPAPCATRLLLQDRIGALSIPTQRPRQRRPR
jgi:hypothetical protein